MVYTLTLSYKGSLNAILTVTFFPKPMDTLEEIAAQVVDFRLMFYRTISSRRLFPHICMKLYSQVKLLRSSG